MMVGKFNPYLLLAIPLAPLVGAAIVGLFGTKFFGNLFSRKASHTVTILGVLIAMLISMQTLLEVIAGATFNDSLYIWMIVGSVKLEIGFLVDSLTAMMMCVVTFISLMVHIYAIGYMQNDEGYNRFFAYISLFTFSMLMLVMSNNFLQLFFSWEAVGLVSYLLIGFWYTRQAAILANIKAFLVNRVSDIGFISGIGLLLAYSGSINYTEVFAQKYILTQLTLPGSDWILLTVVCICLFIGAMGKSALFPLHIWLPDSMEGPTPISALIHAATMVTAGIFMVTRMSPLFELSDTALSFILIIGAITALFMGILGIIQTDLKRVIAYSTLSQLGYMTVAMGASAYSVAVFHLMTHAFFKALLFLSAGSVIIGLHHDQDMCNMGGLRKYMPITWITSLIGLLALIGTPFFSGFYSKESIIKAVYASKLFGSSFAYFAVLVSVFITALYSFRMYFMVFHGKERFSLEHCIYKSKDKELGHHYLDSKFKPHESPWVVTLPLILLAIPSTFIGFLAIEPMLFGNFFKDVIFINQAHHAMEELRNDFHSPVNMLIHAFSALPLWLAISGVASAYYCYIINLRLPLAIKQKFLLIFTVLDNKYYIDKLSDVIFSAGVCKLGRSLWNAIDRGFIDSLIVNGSLKAVSWLSKMTCFWQSGYIYHYAFVMIIGVLSFLVWFMPFPFAK